MGAAICRVLRSASLNSVDSESRLGPTKKGHSSVKCRKKAGRSPTLQLVRVVYEASHHKLNLSLYLEIKQENAVKQVPPNIYF